MARDTLSFFTRLFASKKKKILEKRSKQGEFIESVNNRDQQGYNTENGLEDHGSVRLKESVTNESNIEFREEETEQVSHLKRKAVDGTSISNGENKEFNRFEKNVHTVISTVEKSEEELGSHIEESDQHDRNQSQLSDSSNAVDIHNESLLDDNLEYESMVILSKLEQLQIKISDTTVQKSIPLVIESLVEMVNHVIEFSEQLPKIDRKKLMLTGILQRDEQNYKVLSVNYSENERLVINDSSLSNFENAAHIFVDLSNDLLRLINVYLSASVKAFTSDQKNEQWKTLYAGFFINLTKSVRSSQANQQS